MVVVQGAIPAGRRRPAFVTVDEKLVRCGGSAPMTGNQDWRIHNDLQIYRPSTNTWDTVPDAAGQAPLVSSSNDWAGSHATAIGCSMYVFGRFAKGDEKYTTLGLFQYEVEAEGPTDCKCHPGLTGPNGGTCVQCPAGTYKSAAGSAVCVSMDCPLHASSLPGSVSLADCACMPGYFGPNVN